MLTVTRLHAGCVAPPCSSSHYTIVAVYCMNPLLVQNTLGISFRRKTSPAHVASGEMSTLMIVELRLVLQFALI